MDEKLRERSEPGREEAAAPKAQGRGNLAVFPERSPQPLAAGVGPRGTERGAKGASRAKSEASHKKEDEMAKKEELDIKNLITVPAVITLAVTLLRLVGEFMNLPSWLASKEAGGAGAIIGISWLAPIFGAYFGTKLADAPGKLWKNLLKTLFAYGLAARIPVILIMAFAIFGNWGTHYDAFPPDMADMSPMMKFFFGAVVAQLVFWVCIWTVGTGIIAGLIAAKVRGPRTATA